MCLLKLDLPDVQMVVNTRALKLDVEEVEEDHKLASGWCFQGDLAVEILRVRIRPTRTV